ncbi:MAG TPA: ATP-binding protein [Solirubrobacteraceae bacterium]
MPETTDRRSPLGGLISRLLVQERNLFRVLLVERVVVPAALLAWIASQGGSRTAVTATTGFVAWELATSLAMWGRFMLLRRRPALLLSIEQGACIAIFLAVGTWRGTFYYTLAGPTVFAAAFVGSRLALIYAGVISSVVIAAIGGFHLDDGRGPAGHTTVQDWGGAPPLFFAAAVLVSYIRRLLDQFADASRRKATAAEELASEQARREHAEREANRLVDEEFHDSVQQMLDSLPMRLNALAVMSPVPHDQRALRDAAEIAQRGSMEVRASLRPYQLAARRHTTPENEGNALLERADRQERDYFRAILIARGFFVLLIGVFLIDAGRRFVSDSLMWLGLSVWVGVTSYWWRVGKLYALLWRHPWLLLTEEAVAVLLLFVATAPSGNGFWMIGATAPVAATAVGTITEATSLTICSAVATGGSWYFARALGWDALPNKSGMFAATAGFAGLVLPAVYVRFLFDQLRTAATRVRDDVARLQALRTEEAIDKALHTAQPAIVDAVTHVVSSLRAHLGEVGGDDDDDDELTLTRAQLVELERAVQGVGERVGESGSQNAARLWSLTQTMEAAVIRLGAIGGQARVMPALFERQLPAVTGRLVARALAEALANAWKHSGPPIDISVRTHRSEVEFLVVDHGNGFPVQEVQQAGKLWRLHDYARQADASVQVTSGETGTVVRMVLDA